MPKRKKSRKPAVSRPDPHSLDETLDLQNPTMAESPNIVKEDEDVQHIQNPNLISPVKEDGGSPQIQNSILIEDRESQNPVPVLSQEEKEEDLVIEEQKPQLQNHEQGGNLEEDEEKQQEEPESLDLSLRVLPVEVDLDVEPSAPNVTRRGKKRKTGNRQRVVSEKKLKQDENPISVEEDNDDLKEIPSTDLIVENEKDDQNPGAIEEEKEELELVEAENTDLVEEQKPQNDEKGGDLEANLDGEIDHEEDEDKQEEQQEEEEEKQIEQEEEPQGMNLSSPHHDHAVDEGLVLQIHSSATNVRKGAKRKKLNAKQREAREKKLILVRKNLQPIPFVPGKKLDFSKHEELFRRLGLWDFVNLEFDQDIRADLLALLIANFNPKLHSSIVNEFRVRISRADLARALKLPVKKDKSISLETSDFDSDVLSEESILFVREFLSNWILLHEDMWIYPPEVLKWDALVRKGQPHKVDWAGLIWYMVEKELTQAPQAGTMYYASHIQCLMKAQGYDIKEEPMLEVSMEDEEDAVELNIGSSENFQGLELETQQTELCLGQDKNENELEYREEDGMDYQEYSQEQGGSAPWLLNEKSFMSDHYMRRCNMNEDQNLEGQHMMKEHDDEEGYDPQLKCSPLGGLGSTALLQALGTTNLNYSPTMRHHGHSSGDFFQSGVDTDLGGTSMFANAYKRELIHDDIADHHNINGHHKRMKSATSSSEFDVCMEEIYNRLNKAKAMYEEKEQACLNDGMNGVLVSELQQQNDVLVSNLQKTKLELERKHVENYKLENELSVMKRLLEGYRKALKENRKAFAEYRKRNLQLEEPLYKDVGPGGLVLSTREIEKQRLEREVSEKLQRCMFEQMIGEFQSGWFERLEEYGNDVHHLDTKILELEGKVKLCKEIVLKHKMDES